MEHAVKTSLLDSMGKAITQSNKETKLEMQQLHDGLSEGKSVINCAIPVDLVKAMLLDLEQTRKSQADTIDMMIVAFGEVPRFKDLLVSYQGLIKKKCLVDVIFAEILAGAPK